MTTYKINGKNYTLTDNGHVLPRKGISDLRPNDNPFPVLIALTCDDPNEELVIIYVDHCENLKAEVEDEYRNGIIGDDDRDGEQIASDRLEDCELPDLDDPDQYDVLRDEVFDMMDEQYTSWLSDLLDELKEAAEDQLDD